MQTGNLKRVAKPELAERQRQYSAKSLDGGDHVEKMIELAGRVAEGKVKPSRIRRLSGDDALMVILTLRNSGALAEIDDQMIDLLAEKTDVCRRNPTKKN